MAETEKSFAKLNNFLLAMLSADFCLRQYIFEMLPIAGRDQGLVEAFQFFKW